MFRGDERPRSTSAFGASEESRRGTPGWIANASMPLARRARIARLRFFEALPFAAMTVARGRHAAVA